MHFFKGNNAEKFIFPKEKMHKSALVNERMHKNAF